MIELLPLLFVWAVAMVCGWEDEWDDLLRPIGRALSFVVDGFRGVWEYFAYGARR